MDLTLDESLKALVVAGKGKGYLTYSQVMEVLPEDANDPDMLDRLLVALEDQGIEIVDEQAAESRENSLRDLTSGAAGEEQAVELNAAVSEEELPSTSAEDSTKATDDPVRMYLTQMGEIPLLSRQEEIALAKRIEITRRRFRRKVLECDYALRLAVNVLHQVHREELPFDRTIKISVTENLEKDQILGRMPQNLSTLDRLV